MEDLHDDIVKAQLAEALHIARMTGQDDLVEKAFNDLMEKGHAAEIGEIRVWQGKKYRKEAAGQWVEVRPESSGGMGQMGGAARPVSVGKDVPKKLFSDEKWKQKIADDKKKRAADKAVMSKADYKKTLKSLFTPGEDAGSAYDLARTLAMDKQLVNRVMKDNPHIRTWNDLYERIQWDIEAMESYKAMEDDLIKAGKENIVKAAELLDEESIVEKAYDKLIEKGGEGSRGGKVIGHTRLGKPIYEHSDHPEHANFTHEDHHDARKVHAKLAYRANKDYVKHLDKEIWSKPEVENEFIAANKKTKPLESHHPSIADRARFASDRVQHLPDHLKELGQKTADHANKEVYHMKQADKHKYMQKKLKPKE